MANAHQAELDEQWNRVAKAAAAQVWATELSPGTPSPIYLTEIDRKVNDLPGQMRSAVIDTLRAPEFNAKLDAVSAKLDQLIAALAK